MINLVHFIHGLNMGGAETLVKDYALLMNKEKYNITILCYNRYGSPYEKKLEEAGINVIYMCDEISTWGKRGIFAKIVNHYAIFIKTKKYLKRLNPDIIHYHLTLSKYVAFAKPSRKCRLVLTVHNEPTVIWDKRDLMKKIDFFFTKALIKNYNFKMIALHESMRRELNNLFPNCDIYRVNNGINFERFDVPESKDLIRETLGIPKDAFVIGHVGRFTDQKNQSFLIEIFSEIRKNTNAFLLMVGDGPNKNAAKESINKLGLTKNSLFLDNRIDIPRIMKAMDFFVFPSRYEGLGIVLIEAQKMGLKCLISEEVPDAVLVTNYIKKYSLRRSPEAWKDAILNFYNENIPFEDIELSEWDMRKVCKNLEVIYEK